MLMNPVQIQIVDRLQGLAPACPTLAEHATRYARYCSSIATDGTLQIGHTPWAWPEAYVFRLFTPARKAWFKRFGEHVGRRIPRDYEEFLLNVNGCTAYGLALYGLPPSLQRDPPLLDRSRLQPLDLGTAQRDWAREFKGAGDDFHFGGRAWSHEENVGYFWGADGLRSRRRSGEVVGAWDQLPALLADELAAAEKTLSERIPTEWWH